MLTQEDDVDAHALRKRGWSISAIARHLGHDRKTICAYLNGERAAGARAPAVDDAFGPFVEYCRLRLSRTRICGRRRCSTRLSRLASTGRMRRSPASCAPAACVRRVRRAGRRRAARWR
jgi:transposase